MLKKWPDSQATSQAASSARSCRRRGFIRWLSAVAVVAIHITATPSLAAKPITDDSGVDRNFEAWLSNQGQISLQKLMANISPKDGEPGVVLASPSRRDPDYYFHWVRDAALVMNIVVDQYEGASFGERLEWWRRMDDFVKFSRANQISPAPTGLGEPKFHVDGRPYTGPWGRPQNDGPALRALVLTRYAKTLLQANQWSYVRSKLYDAQIPARTVIKADLEYVAHGWREANFDLWEEVMGDHFYTRLAQLAALREGAELARKLHDDGAAIFYLAQAAEIEKTLANFWDAKAGYIQATVNRVAGVDYKNSGLDTAVILGVLHAGLKSGPFSILDSRVMATASALEATFASIYPVNDRNRFSRVGTALGRYPEDKYEGNNRNQRGNPWVLTTTALAEFYYKVAGQLETADRMYVDRSSSGFLNRRAGTVLHKGTPEMRALRESLIAKGDRLMKRVRLHANPDGSLSEQIDRDSGFMVSAFDLTWSYAGFITAHAARPVTPELRR